MSSLSEAATHRTTLGMLADRYGYELSPKFSRAVTVTSLASDIDSVTAGSLFMPGNASMPPVAAASRKGAYAVMLPKSMRSSDPIRHPFGVRRPDPTRDRPDRIEYDRESGGNLGGVCRRRDQR